MGKSGSLKILALTLSIFLVALTARNHIGVGSSQETNWVRIPAPEKFGSLVEQHVNKMFRDGHFRSLNEGDLFHGHVLLSSFRKSDYDSPEEFSQHVDMVLYHTDENVSVWLSQKHLPPEKRKQRSIVGYPNGDIRPVIELIDDSERKRLSNYDEYGTIYAFELGEQFITTIFLRAEPMKKGQVFTQFTIYPDRNGRFTVAHTRYDVFFEVKEY